MRVIVILAMLLSTEALAQEQKQVTPSELAIQVNQAVNQMATALENSQRAIKQLQDENDFLKKKESDVKLPIK